jgi:hypothetical protein
MGATRMSWDPYDPADYEQTNRDLFGTPTRKDIERIIASEDRGRDRRTFESKLTADAELIHPEEVVTKMAVGAPIDALIDKSMIGRKQKGQVWICKEVYRCNKLGKIRPGSILHTTGKPDGTLTLCCKLVRDYGEDASDEAFDITRLTTR